MIEDSTATPNSTPNKTAKHYMVEDQVFLNEDGWKAEAAAAIKDIEKYVEVILVAGKLESSSSNIYLNLTTKEEKKYTVGLSAQGFQIVGVGHDTVDTTSNISEAVFETPYALLDSVSPTYREAFGTDLVNQLRKLQVEQEERETTSSGTESS